jgi:hypothetical protein
MPRSGTNHSELTGTYRSLGHRVYLVHSRTRNRDIRKFSLVPKQADILEYINLQLILFVPSLYPILPSWSNHAVLKMPTAMGRDSTVSSGEYKGSALRECRVRVRKSRRRPSSRNVSLSYGPLYPLTQFSLYLSFSLPLQTHRSRGSRYGRCLALAGLFLFSAVFMSLGGGLGGEDRSSFLTKNMGQAHQATVDSNGGGNKGDAKLLEEVVDNAVGDIQEVEEEQLLEQLNSASGEEIATDSVITELEEDAQESVEEEVNQIDTTVEEEENLTDPPVDTEEEGQDYANNGNDVVAQEQDAVLPVQEEISDVAVGMKAGLRGRAAEIEREILEERLSLRLGKRVKLLIGDDEFEGIDDLTKGLSSFGGSSANEAGNEAM